MTDRAIWPDACRPVRIRAVDDIDHITNFWDTTTEDDLFGGRVSMSEGGTTTLIGAPNRGESKQYGGELGVRIQSGRPAGAGAR